MRLQWDKEVLMGFIRKMKGARRKQVFGTLFVLDKETGELCGCALGQGLIEEGVINEKKLVAQLKASGEVRQMKMYDPETGKKTIRDVLRNDYADETMKANEWLNNKLPDRFRSSVISRNDHSEVPIPDIAAEQYGMWAERVNINV